MSKKLVTNQAMILAAGFGKRMLPITKHTPKPLIEFNGQPLIYNLIKKLQSNNINDITINSHYLYKKIQSSLRKKFNKNIKIVVEKNILDTGGGIKNAINSGYIKLNSKPLFVLNGDIFWIEKNLTIFERLSEKWEHNKMDVLLTLKYKNDFFGYNGIGDYDLSVPESDCGLIFNNNRKRKYVYTGINLINCKLMKTIKESKFSLKKVFDQAMKKKRLYGLIEKEDKWFHIGTVRDLKTAEELI